MSGVLDAVKDNPVVIVCGAGNVGSLVIDYLRELDEQVVVVEKAISVGFGGVLSTDVAMTLSGLPIPVATVVAGLGGRSITKSSLGGTFEAAGRDELGRLTFLDLNMGLVERELERMALHRRSGPTAENMLRDLGVVASGIG